MSLSLILAIAALVCSILLAVQLQSKLFPIVAAIVAGVEVLIAFGIVRLSIDGIPLGLVLAVALAVAGALSWAKTQGKIHVSAAALVAIVGVMQVLTAVNR